MPTLEYKVVYSKRKTIELRFVDTDFLLIKAPNRTSKKRIEEVLRLKADWIEKARQRSAQRLPTPKMAHGETILLFGEWRKLQVMKNGKEKFDLSTPGLILMDEAFAMHGTNALISLYREQTRYWTHYYAKIYAEKWQLNYSGIRITSARTRWGSCGPVNSLNFSWRLAMTPLSAIEYVVAHELAHTVHHNHSRDFWNFLKKMLPHYAESRKWLKENGSKLPNISV